MAYKVIIPPNVAKEIAAAMAWYAEISPDAARHWRDQLLSHVHTLEQHPERCPQLADESAKMGKDIRQLLHGRDRGQYRILFVINKDIVNLLSIRHTHRQPTS